FRILPIVGLILVMIAAAGWIGLAFIRRSAHALFVSRFEATHDELTGLPNRRLLTSEIEQALDSGRALALVFIDLDRFKDVNDVWGHAAGDSVLREAAERLSAFPELTRVARFGGDEFVVLVEHPALQLGGIPEKLLQALRRPYA